MQIYDVFDRYFSLRCVAISKKHLQPYIYVVLSLFQGTTCSDLGYCVSLKQALAVIPFFKANSQSRWSHPYADRPIFIIKEPLQPRILSNLLCFCRTGIVATRYHNMIYPWYILDFRHAFLERSLLYDDIIPIFSVKESLFHGSPWSDPSQGHCVYFTTLAAAIHYNKRSVVDSRKIEEDVYLRKTIAALWICNH